MHPSLTPAPSPVGSLETCRVAVPWTNEVFYYGIVALDDQGNRGQISNLVAVYIHEEVTTTTSTTSTTTTTTVRPLAVVEMVADRRLEVVEEEEVPDIKTSVFRILKGKSSLTSSIPYLSKTPRVFLPTARGPRRNRARPIASTSLATTPHTTPLPSPPASLTITPSRGFLSIRHLFESELLAEGAEVVYREARLQEPSRRQVRRVEQEKIKDEVYIATGVGGGLLLLVIVISLGLVSRYRRKFLEGRHSTTWRHNSLDLGPSFTHQQAEDRESISKIYSLIKPAVVGRGSLASGRLASKDWLNPLARSDLARRAGSEAGSQVGITQHSLGLLLSRQATRSTDTEGEEQEDRARSAGDEVAVMAGSSPGSVLVDVDRYVLERAGSRHLERKPNKHALLEGGGKRSLSEVGSGHQAPETGSRRALSEVGGESGMPAKSREGEGAGQGEHGKLLLEVYSGGTFKKSMNYYR